VWHTMKTAMPQPPDTFRPTSHVLKPQAQEGRWAIESNRHALQPQSVSQVRHRLFATADHVRASPIKAWGLAIVTFTVAVAVRFLSDHLLPPGFPYLTFFPAVILTAFFAGVLPGILCAFASGLAAWYWFIAPFGAFTFNSSVLVALGFYVCVVGVDILLIHVMHKAVEGLEAERARTSGLIVQQELLLADQRARERQQRILKRELSHRMKNTLAMVQAIVSQSLRNATEPQVAAELAAARIQALSRAQDTLTATDWSTADVETIVRAAIAPHTDRQDRFVVSGPVVEVMAQRALGLALAIHELATNSTKYGALSSQCGSVAISWDVSGSDGFHFAWTEAGGPLVVEPTKKGFGSRLTERVVPSYFDGRAKTLYVSAGIQYRLDGSLASLRNEPATTEIRAH
jgi:two-component sensor histidine kinase